MADLKSFGRMSVEEVIKEYGQPSSKLLSELTAVELIGIQEEQATSKLKQVLRKLK